MDYGPCAFMDAYDPATVFSSIDQYGRYAFGKQPSIGFWNLARLAETLLALIDTDEQRSVARATETLQEFPRKFQNFYLAGMRRKMGLQNPAEGDAELVQDLLNLMQAGKADFTLVFRRLGDEVEGASGAGALFTDPEGFEGWSDRWRQRLSQEPMNAGARAAAMRQVSPAVIPRNYLVEEVLAAAVDQGDFRPFHRLLEVLQRPFDAPDNARYSAIPPRSETIYRTFCGT